jgi:hypothetical protein
LRGLAVVGLPGCQQKQPLTDVKLYELRPRPIPVPGAMEEARRASVGATQAAPVRPADLQQQLVVQRSIFSRDDARLAMALGLLDPVPLDDATARVWKANGFGIGQIDRNRLTLWTTNLPRPVTTNVYVIATGPEYSALTLIGKVDAAQRIRVTDTQGQTSQHQLIGGQWQMMVNLIPPLVGTGATPRLQLLPHHYGPQVSVLPRTPQEKQFDGTSFSQLSLEHPLPQDKVWVIWADSAQPADAPDANDDAAEAPDPDRIGITGPRPAARPTHVPLAQAMLTGRRADHRMQIVLLIAQAP